jgi:two-component system phosphate regulon sensor histidine kinase PhoR
MRTRLSFHVWILGGCLLVALCTILLMGWVLSYSFRELMVAQIKDSLAKDIALVSALISEGWIKEPHRRSLDALADELGHMLGMRVTFIAPDGRVLGDSQFDEKALPGMENHASRPEVRDALKSGQGWGLRRSASLGTDLLYVAGLLGTADEPQMVLRLAIPLDRVDREAAATERSILWASLLGVLLAVGVAYLVARRIARPVKDLSRASLRMIRDLDTISEKVSSSILHPHARFHNTHEVGDLGEAIDQMAGQLRNEIQAVTLERDRLEAILTGMVEGVLVTDGEGRIVLVNQALRRMLRMDADPTGRTPLEMLRSVDLQEALKQVLGGTQHVSLEIRTLPPNPRSLEIHVVRLAGEAFRAGAVAVFHDITERKRVEEVRRDFVANVSHELRTPLAAIAGSVETLLGGAVEDPRYARQFVEMIQRHASRLRDLLEDLLDLARIESGEPPSRREEIKVEELIRAALAAVSHLAKEKEIVLLEELPDRGIALRGDRKQMEQALVNLLENAVKYTDSGGTVTVEAKREGSEIHFIVSDTGCGIPEEHLPRIFDRFYRVDKARSREMGGTGLGLSIVKHVAQAHGGRVEVESTPGRGSTFKIIVPG